MTYLSDLYITSPNQLGKKLHTNEFTNNDGLGLWSGKHYIVENSILDLSSSDNVDEALAITYGSSAEFTNCLIRGAGKLILCGSGDEEVREKEYGKEVTFSNCILENCGRRSPEVQVGMKVTLENCLIRNWGNPEFFSVRNFGGWAHDSGKIVAKNCVFWQDRFYLNNFFRDIGNHVGQAIKDNGIIQLINPFSYRLGICRGLVGNVEAINCYKNKWWIKLDNRNGKMSKKDALELIDKLEMSIMELKNKLCRNGSKVS